MLASFCTDKKPNERVAEAMRNKWPALRSTFIVAVRNCEKFGQGEGDALADFASGDPIMSYMLCSVFSNISHDSKLLCAKLETIVGQSAALATASFLAVQLENVFQDEESNSLELLEMLSRK